MADPSSAFADLPLPREQLDLFGQDEAEDALLRGYQSGRLHHAWLIGGPEGIGKATLAYRFARFLLAQTSDRSIPPTTPATTLAIAPDHPASRQVAALSHPNLLVLDPALFGTDKGPARMIPVEAVRRVVSFFGSTASDGGYRICIIDSAETLTNASANALLKAIEEPPARSIFLIVSHAPQRVMATIRSRCRKLSLHPLNEADLRRALKAPGAAVDADLLARAIELAEGSVRQAMEMLDPDKAALIADVTRLLDALPRLDTKRVLGLADKLALRQKDEAYVLALETIRRWLSAAIDTRQGLGPARLVPLALAWETMNETARVTDIYNLDRRPFVLSLFGDLAEAVRQAG